MTEVIGGRDLATEVTDVRDRETEVTRRGPDHENIEIIVAEVAGVDLEVKIGLHKFCYLFLY